jgi:hypothetical protein
MTSSHLYFGIIFEWDHLDIKELVMEIERNPTSLFYGAGVCETCGGPTWKELFRAIKAEFPGGKSDEFFAYMDEIIGYNNENRAQVEEFIRGRLASISPGNDQKYLFSIPWKAVLTTNYDHLPQAVNTTIDERRKIYPVANADEQIDQAKTDRLYCFKLLGDSDYSFRQGGWMILKTSDLFAASDRRNVFFQQFRQIALSGHVVYLGYSFADNLVFLLLEQMKTHLGQFPWKGFAIMPSEPEPAIKQRLDSAGITLVQGTLETFISAAKSVFGEIPQSAATGIGFLTLHRQVMRLDRSVLSNIYGRFSILHDDMLKQHSQGIADFLEGKDLSFFPYVLRWDFPRKTTLLWKNAALKMPVAPDFLELARSKERAKDQDTAHNLFVALVGMAGSGKTVVANRLAFEWYQGGNPVVFIDAGNQSIDFNALDGLMNEVWEKYRARTDSAKIKDMQPLRWLIIADDCGPLFTDLKTLKSHFMSVTRPADMVIVTRETDLPIENLKCPEIDSIYKINDTVGPEQREEFLKHFRRYGLIDEDLARANLQDKEINSSFFALMYSLIHNCRENIKSLLSKEYNKLDSESKRVYRNVALIQSYRLGPPQSLIVKSQNTDPDWLRVQVNKGNLSGILRFSELDSTLMANNRIIADIISELVFRTSEERKQALERIISAVTLLDTAELRLLENLMNRRIELDIGPRLDVDHKLYLFRKAISVVESRPLLIHLGRIETSNEKFVEASQSLKRAYGAHVEGFDERIQHVYDAEGRLELAIARYEIKRDHPEIAQEHLEIAEGKFAEAKINPRITPHPYEGLGQTYLTQAQIQKDEGIRWAFLLAAMEECRNFESYLGEASEMYLLKMEIGNILYEQNFDESQISKIKDPAGKANGYAYLAENQILDGKWQVALETVRKGLKLDPSSTWLMRLSVQLLRKISPQAHEEIMQILDDYASISNKKYDIELSFELAKETYMAGRVEEARSLFKTLFVNARHHKRRLIIRDPVDRWMEGGAPKRLDGTFVQLPTESRYGFVVTTYPPMYKDRIVVRKKDVQIESPRPHQPVTYEIVFNMYGPEASKVRLP